MHDLYRLSGFAGWSRENDGYWFNMRQSSSQVVCLVLIDLSLLALIVFDLRRKVSVRTYVIVLTAYLVIETVWFSLGRPV